MAAAGSDRMGSAFFVFEAKGFSPHIGNGFVDKSGHFFSSFLDEFSWVVGGWVGGLLEERADWCVFGGTSR
jgi:hypothetical protein